MSNQPGLVFEQRGDPDASAWETHVDASEYQLEGHELLTGLITRFQTIGRPVENGYRMRNMTFVGFTREDILHELDLLAQTIDILDKAFSGIGNETEGNTETHLGAIKLRGSISLNLLTDASATDDLGKKRKEIVNTRRQRASEWMPYYPNLDVDFYCSADINSEKLAEILKQNGFREWRSTSDTYENRSTIVTMRTAKDGKPYLMITSDRLLYPSPIFEVVFTDSHEKSDAHEISISNLSSTKAKISKVPNVNAVGRYVFSKPTKLERLNDETDANYYFRQMKAYSKYAGYITINWGEYVGQKESQSGLGQMREFVEDSRKKAEQLNARFTAEGYDPKDNADFEELLAVEKEIRTFFEAITEVGRAYFADPVDAEINLKALGLIPTEVVATSFPLFLEYIWGTTDHNVIAKDLADITIAHSRIYPSSLSLARLLYDKDKNHQLETLKKYFKKANFYPEEVLDQVLRSLGVEFQSLEL